MNSERRYIIFFPLKKSFLFYTVILLFISRGNGLIHNFYYFDYGEWTSLKQKFTMKTKYWRKCSRKSSIKMLCVSRRLSNSSNRWKNHGDKKKFLWVIWDISLSFNQLWIFTVYFSLGMKKKAKCFCLNFHQKTSRVFARLFRHWKTELIFFFWFIKRNVEHFTYLRIEPYEHNNFQLNKLLCKEANTHLIREGT